MGVDGGIKDRCPGHTELGTCPFLCVMTQISLNLYSRITEEETPSCHPFAYSPALGLGVSVTLPPSR